MDKREAVNKVKEYSKLVKQHFDIENVYLFGSFANNQNREDSDIDVALVMKNIDYDFFDINPILWRLRREIDDRIEPILIDSNNDKAGFLEEIKKNSVKIM